MGCIIFDINGGGKIARPSLFKRKRHNLKLSDLALETKNNLLTSKIH